MKPRPRATGTDRSIFAGFAIGTHKLQHWNPRWLKPVTWVEAVQQAAAAAEMYAEAMAKPAGK